MKKSFLGLVLVSFLVTGCSPIFYTPNTQNVPMISSKGDNKITVAGNGNQVELQGAYGLTDAFAIQANAGLFIPRNLDNGDGGSGNFFEVGGGYFKSIKEVFVFEAYGILGMGSMENHFKSTVEDNPGTNGDISSTIFRVGVQPSFGYKSKYFEAAISTRIVSLIYSNIEGDLIYSGNNQMDYLNDNKTNFLVEPAITLRGGFEKIKLQVQYGYSLNLTNTAFKQDKSYLTLGLSFKL
ncbi:MAG: hypothetical protein WC135_03930 [Bacteroidales bacterium]